MDSEKNQLSSSAGPMSLTVINRSTNKLIGTYMYTVQEHKGHFVHWLISIKINKSVNFFIYIFKTSKLVETENSILCIIFFDN